MTVSIEAKQARQLIRATIKETERLLDKTVARGYGISQATLMFQVALNTGEPLADSSKIVRAYLAARTDLYVPKGTSRIIQKV
jgi:hypothetical protein